MQRRINLTLLAIMLIGILTSVITSFGLYKLMIPSEVLPDLSIKILKYNMISITSGILISLTLSIRYIKKVVEPIERLTGITRKISDGNYGQKIYTNTDDDLYEISKNFNTISGKLEETIYELQESNTKMKSILTSMLDGVIALDNSNNIILVNPSVEEMFNIKSKDIIGKNIKESIENKELSSAINKLIEKDKIASDEIEINHPRQKFISIHSNIIRLEKDPNRIMGVVIILQDVTDIRKLESMRKDFVANVSHELKTPLTSMKGFIETLKSGSCQDVQTRNRFLDIIDIETNRLTYLIQDLLVLSEIENEEKLIYDDKIDIKQNIQQITNILSKQANKKKINIVQQVDEDISNIKGNEDWFKQMLINLIDNAIKYTPNGGTINIVVYEYQGNIYINISDTGIGIEKGHLSRLFERFYRVDKARSRQVGGTGLGLAIVKHIVISFDGTIEVESELNKGTSFNIKLPL